MKKGGLLIILLTLWILPASAQVTWGVRVGGAYSALVQKIDNEVETGACFGYSMAGILEIPVWREFTLRPELGIVSQGGSFTSFYGTGMIDESYSMTKNTYRYYSVQLPINICYTFTFSEVGVNLFGGPVFDYALTGKIKSDLGGSNDLKFGKDADDDLRPFDLGVSIGLGVEFKHFTFSINAISGTLNRRPVKDFDEKSVYQNNVTLSLGYFFR